MPADAIDAGGAREAPRTRPRVGRVRHAPDASAPHPLLPYFRLVRAPAVFSALGDPLAGLLIGAGRLPARRAARLSSAAALLYLAGMALNDLADRAEDARERPERPIPSGAVSPHAAALVGTALLMAGAVVARDAGARRTGPALAALVAAYDFDLKHSAALGPTAMGACRSLSLLMGVEAARRVDMRSGARPRTRRGREAAVLLGAYVAGLTLVARGETGAARRRELRLGATLAATALLASAWRGGARSVPWAAAVAALAGPAVARALREPAPATVGPAVGALIRAIPALDGALAAADAPGRALLLLPLLGLVRWGRALIPIT
ncbi:UbiA prenyltransferase (plasmid) [Gemmatirosa kalamazoonensis]|uniref:UbiA prenyltransferase n=1 Tax=Gemmatirosa kalamazoonensis TaxID=861299 RepID=W0RQA1_9BACT|nr:UbiA family prenyltransferase [Gemmatirosa kalamazoonensis]AHG93174.1 UbiA prenyltransferase [Gemmatirosa kalamazoonensis]